MSKMTTALILIHDSQSANVVINTIWENSKKGGRPEREEENTQVAACKSVNLE